MPGAATVRRERLREYARRRIAVDLQSGIVHHVEPDLQGQPPQVQRPQGLFSDSQFEIDRHFKVDRQFESDVCTRLPTSHLPATHLYNDVLVYRNSLRKVCPSLK